MRGLDLNQRPLGYEPNELPGCSTPLVDGIKFILKSQFKMGRSIIMNIETVRQNWDQRGFSCQEWVDPAGQVWKNYVHDVDELLMVLEGALNLEMQGRIFNAVPGKEFFIPACTVHSVSNVGEKTARWLYGYKKL